MVDWLGKLLHSLAYLKAADTNAGIKVDVNISIPGKVSVRKLKILVLLKVFIRLLSMNLRDRRRRR